MYLEDVISTVVEHKNRYDFLSGQVQKEIRQNFSEFGIHPHCIGCPESCRQYNADNVLRIVCKRGEWKKAVT